MAINLIVKGTIIEGKQQSLRSLITMLKNNFVEKEEGCINYEPYIDGNTFILIERWKDQQALDEHLAAEHMQKYLPEVKAYLQGNALDIHMIKDGEEIFF